MEQVDIVDENLKIIDTVSKDEAHEKGLLHKTVIAEVINSRGQMLLVRQSSHKQDAGQYVSPVGGHVSAGEIDDDALRREAMEETGIKDFSFKHLGNFIFDRVTRGKRENHYFLVYEIQADHTPVLNDESDGYKWFTKEEIKRELSKNKSFFGNAFVPIWERFYKNEL
jgi:isopentenyl-diphosphate delta-isomerase